MTEAQKKLVDTATQCVGAPYKYGATHADIPRAFDCSLFIQHIFKIVNVELPRSTIEQAAVGTVVPDLAHAEVGDLVFLHGTRGHYNPQFPEGIGHVAMVLEDGKAIHARSKRTSEQPITEVGQVEIDNLTDVIERGKPIVRITRPLA